MRVRLLVALVFTAVMFSFNTQTASAQTFGPNLIANPTLEAGTTLPTGWIKGGYGTNTRTLTYPVAGDGGGKAVKTEITAYTSGDAKWVFTAVNVSGGTYRYEDRYQSNRTSIVTAQIQHSNGSLTYQDIATLAASANFASMSADFTMPSTATKVTIFHLINGPGSVTIDNALLRRHEAGGVGDIFDTGAVTFRFDDGWTSQYQNALPKLNSAGIKGSFYIITHQMFEDGFTGYINQTQLQAIYNAGHEIGAHTRTHRNLNTLSTTERQNEITGSRQDLIGWGFGPILSFAVPFGAYNQSVIDVVKSAGFQSMVTSDGHQFNKPDSDRYRLTRFPITSATTVAQVKQAIDQADANNEWLIISFHEVNTSGRTYAITPTKFNEIVDYVVLKGIPVITTSEGAQDLP